MGCGVLTGEPVERAELTVAASVGAELELALMERRVEAVEPCCDWEELVVVQQL